MNTYGHQHCREHLDTVHIICGSITLRGIYGTHKYITKLPDSLQEPQHRVHGTVGEQLVFLVEGEGECGGRGGGVGRQSL